MSPSQIPFVVVVGSLNRDLVVRVPALPLRGETVRGANYSRHNGGKGANQAVALARLGQHVAMIGCVGDDDDGTSLVSALAADGVDVGSVSTSSSRTGVAVITVEDSGENSIVVVAGANGDLDEAAIDAVAPTIAAADIVLSQLEVPTAAVARAFSHATGTVVLNPAPGILSVDRLLESVDYLIPNRTELATMSGRGIPTNEAEILGAVRSLAFRGVVIVTLGSDGALAVRDGAVVARAHPPGVEVVDTVGAGDAFCAGICDALGRALPLQKAITWATACGTLATTKAGAQPSMPSASAVAHLIAGQ